MSFNIPGPKVPGTNVLRTLTVTEKANIEEMDIKRFKVSESIKVGSVLIEDGFITGLNDPVVPDGAATKKYVDEIIGPTVWKNPCRLATAILENLPLLGLSIVDGIQTVSGDRILVKNQTNGVDNGYYLASSGAWSRTVDMSVGKHVAGYTTIVQEGTDNEDTAWFCINDEDSDTVGTDVLVFSKFSSYDIAGVGLSKSGSILNVNTDNTTIYVDMSNDLSLTDTTVTAGTYGTSTQVSSFDVDSQGRITSAQNVSVQDASASQKGLVTINDQTFSGIKTFTDIHTTYLSGLSNPVGNTDAANKAYVDAVASGIDWTEPVRVISIAQIDLVTGGLLTVDGVVLSVDDRVLLVGGSTAFPNVSGSSVDNGIYLAKVGSWLRSTDMPAGSGVSGHASFISQGTIYSNTGFVCTTSVPDIVGTDALQWVQFAGNSVIIAGDALTKTGNVLDVNVDNVGIEISGNNLQLKDSGVVSSKLADTAVTAGSYGSSSQIPSITIDAKGRITSASNNSITTGDVYGPNLSNDNAISRFDGTTGKLIQNSAAYIDDSGNISCNYLTSTVLTGVSPFTVSSTTAVTNLKADTVVTNANLTGPITSTGNTTLVNSQTGTGSTFVMQTSPLLTTPDIGVAIGTTLTNSIGSVSAPSYTFTGRTSTGIYSSAVDVVSLTSGSVQTLESTTSFINLPLTSASTSGSLGALRLAGGIGISNTTDATSTSNGGTFTTNGGAAVAKKLYVGFSSNATNHIDGYSTTATSAGTTILTVNSNRLQYFTGSTTHTVRMPATSTLVLGQSYIVSNSSTGAVTVQSSGSNTITILPANTQSLLTCISTATTTAADWSINVSVNTLSSGNIIVGNSNNVPSSVAMSGNATITNAGVVTVSQSTNATNATNATNINLTPTTANGSYYIPVFNSSNLSGNYPALTSSGLYYNPTSLNLAVGTNSATSSGFSAICGPSASNSAYVYFIENGSFKSRLIWDVSNSKFIINDSNTNTTINEAGGNITIGNTGTITTLSGTTDSTSTTTGALKLSGGIGISNVTDASSSTNGGTFTTAGGVGIAKKLYVGTDIFAGSINLGSTSTRNRITVGTTTNSSTATPDCLDLGATYSNAAGTNLKIKIYNDGTVANGFGNSTNSIDYVCATADSHNFYTGSTKRMTLDNNGRLNLTVTTASTSNTTGSFTTAGGIGISNVTDATSTTNGGTFTTAGGAAIAKKLYVGTDFYALGGNYNVTASGTVYSSTITNYEFATNLINLVQSPVTTASGGTQWRVNGSDKAVCTFYAGEDRLRLDAFGTAGICIGSGGTVVTKFEGTVDASSNTTGAVRISGGVGIVKKLYLGDNLTIGAEATTKTISAPNATTTNNSGGGISVLSGNGNGTGAGGALNLTSGTGGATAAGGSVTLTTGNGGATSGNSGTLTLNTGTIVSGTTGSIVLQTGGVTRSTISTTLITPTIPIDYYKTSLSLLYNGSFSVWQRGPSGIMTFSASSNAYSADRWQFISNVNQACTITRTEKYSGSNTYFCRVQRNSGQTGTTPLLFGQTLTREMSSPAIGRVITLSYDAKAGANYSASLSILRPIIYTGTGTTDVSGINAGFTGSSALINAPQVITTTLTRYTVTTSAVPSNATQIALVFIFGPGGTAGADDSYYLGNVQLEVAPFASPYFGYISYSEELTRCYRFFQVLTSLGATYGANGSTSIQTNITPYVEMRTIPILGTIHITTGAMGGTITITDSVANYTQSSFGGNITYALDGKAGLYGIGNFSGITLRRPYAFNINLASIALTLSAEIT